MAQPMRVRGAELDDHRGKSRVVFNVARKTNARSNRGGRSVGKTQPRGCRGGGPMGKPDMAYRARNRGGHPRAE